MKAAYDRAHQIFVENKWVENVRILNQNYQESKRYYENMQELANYSRGGIAGYVRDRILDDIDRSNRDAYWRFDNHMNSDPENTAYVRKWMNDLDQKLYEKLDYTKEIREIGKKRDQDLKDITRDMGKPQITAEDKTRIDRRVSLMQLELLADLNKNITQLLKHELEKDQQEWTFIRARYIEQEKELKSIKAMYDEYGKMKPKKDPRQVLQEIPR